MLQIFKSIDGKFTQLNEIEENCWINLTAPTEEELYSVGQKVNIEQDQLRAALDEEETSHIDYDDGNTLIIIDLPVVKKDENKAVFYSTIPLGIIFCENNLITVCLEQPLVMKELASGEVKGLIPHFKTQFMLKIMLRVAMRYLQYLRQIEKISDHVERQLHKSMKNKELIQLLELEKSLVYFSTSLRANEVTIEKISRGKLIKMHEEDRELLEDVLIEIKQAIEMSNIYTNILSGTMDAFASIISNNLNIVMKVLTSITIILTIPTMVASFYGMNVLHMPLSQFWWFPVVLSVGIASVIMFILKKKNMLF